jgi:transposase
VSRLDAAQFPQMVTRLASRYAVLGDIGDLTVTWDAGQNSADNQRLVADAGLGFAASLPPSDFRALLDVPDEAYRTVDQDRYAGPACFEEPALAALGTTGRAVVTHSPTPREAQERGFAQTLAKALGRLGELQATLARGRARAPKDKVEAKIAAILADRWARQAITADLTGDAPPALRLDYRADQDAIDRLAAREFGKRVLFTNRADWPAARVIAAYRAQNQVESPFRQMKDPDPVSFSPMRHQAEQKIRVHAPTRALALLVAHIMRRQARHAGIDASFEQIATELAGVQEVTMVYPAPGKGRPRARRMPTQTTPLQDQPPDLYNARRHAC